MLSEIKLTDIDNNIYLALKNSLYPGALDESISMVIAYCKAANLDPMLKPVHIVPMSVKDAKTKIYDYRDVVMPGIGLYRIQADRTGLYAGISEPEYGPDVTEKIGNKEITYPKLCKVTVYKIVKGEARAFVAKELWKENYATKSKDDPSPNAMWTKRPYGQLAKCTEAQALRKAFPELGSQPTAEEMEGKAFDNYIDGELVAETTVDKIQIFKEQVGIIDKKEEVINKNISTESNGLLQKAQTANNFDELNEIMDLARELDSDTKKSVIQECNKRRKEILTQSEK